MGWLITRLAQETSVYTDDVWVADSSPVECACTNAEEVLILILKEIGGLRTSLDTLPMSGGQRAMSSRLIRSAPDGNGADERRLPWQAM